MRGRRANESELDVTIETDLLYASLMHRHDYATCGMYSTVNSTEYLPQSRYQHEKAEVLLLV